MAESVACPPAYCSFKGGRASWRSLRSSVSLRPMKLTSLPRDFLRAIPVLALAAIACTSGCAAPTDDDGEDEGGQIEGAPNAPDDPNDTTENTGTVESEIASCPNSGSGALLTDAHRSGNFNWVTTLVDTRRDGNAPSVRVEIYDPGAHFGPATRVYTHRNTKGCTKSSTYSYHINPPVCVRDSGDQSLRVRMWLYNGSKRISSREVWTKIRCID